MLIMVRFNQPDSRSGVPDGSIGNQGILPFL